MTFLDRALAWFAGHGVTVEPEMTDNGSAHRSHRWRQTCRSSGLRQLRTKPYTPRTNGKAQRFIQTSPREWACAQAYPSPLAHHEAPAGWLAHYNTARPYTALVNRPPLSDLAKPSCLIRPKGPFLRPDLARPATAAAGRGKDRLRRPANAGAQRPCGGPTLRSRLPQERPMLDTVNNVRDNNN